MSHNGQKFSSKRRALFAGGIGLAALGPLGLSGCGGADAGTGNANPAPAPAAEGVTRQASSATVAPRVFVHPGLLHTEADFERMRTKVEAKAQPWLSGWDKLLVTGRSHLGNNPRPLETVIRGGDGQNVGQMFVDVARVYQIAVRWKVSGDTAYADKAVEYLNAWSSTMKVLTGNADRFLAAGIYGYQFANAAEIMRDYPGWAAADFARFKALMLDVFYPLSHHFLVHHNGTEDNNVTNYWANWDQCNLASILAIGVLCDREDLYDEAINYYKYGRGNGASSQAVYYIHPGYLGQWQESGRDQGHTTLGIGLAGAFCEMAFNQGDDMYAYDNNRFLAGAEYVAKSNLADASGAFYSVPFTRYRNVLSDHTGVSPAALGHSRPVWELVYHHYVNRRGLAAPYTALQRAKIGPEGDGTNGDQLGIGTLTFSRDPIPGVPPSGVSAIWSGQQMQLSWWGTAGASSYKVKRATSAAGPYTTIASGITDLLTYNDTGMAPGVYFYVVTADTAAGESAPSAAVRALAGVQLHTRLAFDEGTGGTVGDATGNGHAGTLQGGAGWGAGRNGGSALALNGTGAYLSLPQDVVMDLSDFTIAAWVYWDASRTWARIFDFGAGTRHYMMLTPRSGNGEMRFAITTNHGIGEQVVSGPGMATGQWVHVAVTLNGSVGTLYVNGSAVGSNDGVKHAPFRLGSTNQNWIGRSQFANDPSFNGRVDDLRIYHGAFSAAEILALSRA